MPLSDSSPTPYDLRFDLLGFPVRIHPGFWVVSVMLGMDLPPRLLPFWVAAVLVSVVVHELGHAVLQRRFGGRPRIVLYTLGGYAAADGVDDAWWKNVLVALAGPLAGFALWGAVLTLLVSLGEPANRFANAGVRFLLWINLAWGIINLAPIWPLDGGRVARELLVRFLRPSTGVVASLWLSIGTAVVVAAFLWLSTGSLWNVALFGLLGYQSYEALVAYRGSRDW